MLPNQVWIYKGQSTQGPFTIPEIQAKLAKGEVTWGTKICPIGETQWQPLHSVPGLIPDAQRPMGARSIHAAFTPIGAASLQTRSLWIRLAVISAGVALIVAAGSYLLRLNLFAPFERGYGDTVLRYQKRNYDGAKWTKIQDLASLSKMAQQNNLKFSRVAGWDNDNYWVADNQGRVFQLRGGHWQSPVKMEIAVAPCLRVENASTLLIAGTNLYRLSRGGFVEIGYVNQSKVGELFPANNDVLYSYRKGVDPIQFSVEKRTVGTVRKELKVPAPEASVKVLAHHVADIRHVRPVRSGLAYGVSSPIQGSGKKYLVRFKDRHWWKIDELPSKGELPEKEVQDLWLSGTEEAPHAVLVGEKGWVYVQSATDVGEERTLDISNMNLTSRNLIKVWGASPDKFWVMDSNGTIWELNRSKSIIKVTGIQQNDFKFEDAWVSPTGTVFAITEQALYRLD